MKPASAKYKVGVYISYRQRLLLIREISEGHKNYRWNIVKGTVEARDRSFLLAAKRESFEEVGLRIKPMGVLNISYRRRRKNPVIQINVLAVSLGGRPKIASRKQQQLHNEDIIEVKYFSPAELLKIPQRELMNIRVYRGLRRWIRSTKRRK